MLAKASDKLNLAYSPVTKKARGANYAPIMGIDSSLEARKICHIKSVLKPTISMAGDWCLHDDVKWVPYCKPENPLETLYHPFVHIFSQNLVIFCIPALWQAVITLIKLWHTIYTSQNVCTCQKKYSKLSLDRMPKRRAKIQNRRLAIQTVVEEFNSLSSEQQAAELITTMRRISSV